MNEDLINVRMLTPFRKFIMSVGEIPSTYMDSMTYYEMLNWFCNYLQNEVIPSVNTNANAVKELQNLYIELKGYVDNYFDNLDVQEEINNKLDDMVESGVLTSLIKDYVDPIYSSYQNNIDNEINEMNNKINSVTSGTPLVATSIEEMTDTSRIYVNTSNGNWYYYNGKTWQSGGLYQSSGIADNSINPQKTTFIKTNNLLYYNKPSKNFTITGATANELSIRTVYSRYCSIIPVIPNSDYTLFFTPFNEDGVNYFKICSTTYTKEELEERLSQNINTNVDGNIHAIVYNNIHYRTGPNDKSIIIQFSNDTNIEYAELLMGNIDTPEATSYKNCLNILDFDVYTQEEVNSIINNKIHAYDILNKPTYSLSNNILTINFKNSQFIFRKITNSSNHLDTWRLYSGTFKKGNITAKMWENSDAEGPIRLINENDFVSGYHGYETMTDLKILIDNVLIANDDTINETFFENITIICQSNVYHNNASNPELIAFNRFKKLIFSNNKITISNQWIVKDTNGLNIERYCDGLFQTFKSYNDINIVNYVNMNNDLMLRSVDTEKYYIGNANNDTKEFFIYTDFGTVKIRSIKNIDKGTYNPFIYNYNNQNRIKPYFINDNFTVNYNDELYSEFEIEIL